MLIAIPEIVEQIKGVAGAITPYRLQTVNECDRFRAQCLDQMLPFVLVFIGIPEDRKPGFRLRRGSVLDMKADDKMFEGRTCLMDHFTGDDRPTDKKGSWQRCLDDALASLDIVFDGNEIEIVISNSNIICELFEMELGPVDLGPTTFKRIIRHHGITREFISRVSS